MKFFQTAIIGLLSATSFATAAAVPAQGDENSVLVTRGDLETFAELISRGDTSEARIGCDPCRNGRKCCHWAFGTLCQNC
ncbi:hypothetical protein ACHAQA_007306 [Verticillium albo-atrum]